MTNKLPSHLWAPTPQAVESAHMTQFMRLVTNKTGMLINSFKGLYEWSVTDLESFWSCVWDFCKVIGHKGPRPYVIPTPQMWGTQFFPQGSLNYAQNLLRRRDDDVALFFWGEDQVKRTVSFKELYNQVSRLVQHFQQMGIKKGDRVAAYVPNTPEAIIAMLAATALGAIWSSCSPDFGIAGVVDRFQQIEPKILIVADEYIYKGKFHSYMDKVRGVQAQLPSLEQTIVFSYKGEEAQPNDLAQAISWEVVQNAFEPVPIEFELFPFNTPLFIMFSSGTTGVPKCIIHGAGGTLLQHLKEHQLHCDVHPHDRVFYFTTCGWMMWNWHVAALASEASVVLYDGSPFAPTPSILFDYADAVGMTLFGTSAKYIESLRKENVTPCQTHSLATVRTMTSTGSPLSHEGFEYVYDHIKKDIALASISGGTDIISCFVLGNPLGPVYSGEIQTAGLGMAVHVFDPQGNSVCQQKGELVCIKPFPSMPLGFWHDPHHEKYEKAYFSHFPGVWCHGDFAEITDKSGMIIYGRSDAVLNPGGVRIGTAEIYRQVETIEEVMESIAVGQDYQDDVRIVLFVKMRDGQGLTIEVEQRIKQKIRHNASPRHVPALIIQVPDIPKTKNGKLVELAVRDIINGKDVTHTEALLNPEALEFFRGLKI